MIGYLFHTFVQIVVIFFWGGGGGVIVTIVVWFISVSEPYSSIDISPVIVSSKSFCHLYIYICEKLLMAMLEHVRTGVSVT